MDRFEFYKEQYYKELDRKNEITNSLNMPIGILTVFVATLFYLLASFKYSNSNILFYIFIIFTLFVVVFLIVSVYHLIKALSNLHNGYLYAYLNDTDDLEEYRVNLMQYYSSIGSEDISEKEFEEYIEKELIKSTGINQKNNKLKTFHRFLHFYATKT